MISSVQGSLLALCNDHSWLGSADHIFVVVIETGLVTSQASALPHVLFLRKKIFDLYIHLTAFSWILRFSRIKWSNLWAALVMNFSIYPKPSPLYHLPQKYVPCISFKSLSDLVFIVFFIIHSALHQPLHCEQFHVKSRLLKNALLYQCFCHCAQNSAL